MALADYGIEATGDLVGFGMDPTSMTGNSDSNGSCTFPNGLIMKWGKTTTDGSDTTITFATAFPTACFQAFAVAGSSTDVTWNVQSYSITAASFIVAAADEWISPIRWFAVGR